MDRLARKRHVINDTHFVSLHEEGEWVVGYYARKGDPAGRYFLSIHNIRTGRSYNVDQLVPAHIKSKYIFWKNMLVD